MLDFLVNSCENNSFPDSIPSVEHNLNWTFSDIPFILFIEKTKSFFGTNAHQPFQRQC